MVNNHSDFESLAVEQVSALREPVTGTEAVGKDYTVVSASLLVPQIKQTPWA